MKNLLSYVYLYNFIINYVYIFFNTFCIIKIFNHMLKQFIVFKILICTGEKESSLHVARGIRIKGV